MQKQIGKMLLQIRLKLNYTLEEFCAFLGVTVYDYLRYENGFFLTKDEMLIKILKLIKEKFNTNEEINKIIIDIEKILN